MVVEHGPSYPQNLPSRSRRVLRQTPSPVQRWTATEVDADPLYPKTLSSLVRLQVPQKLSVDQKLHSSALPMSLTAHLSLGQFPFVPCQPKSSPSHGH